MRRPQSLLLGKPLEFRVPMKAGTRLIGVTFVERDEVRDEEVLRPRLRSTGPETAVQTVTLSGPTMLRGRATRRRAGGFLYAGPRRQPTRNPAPGASSLRWSAALTGGLQEPRMSRA